METIEFVPGFIPYVAICMILKIPCLWTSWLCMYWMFLQDPFSVCLHTISVWWFRSSYYWCLWWMASIHWEKKRIICSDTYSVLLHRGTGHYNLCEYSIDESCTTNIYGPHAIKWSNLFTFHNRVTCRNWLTILCSTLIGWSVCCAHAGHTRSTHLHPLHMFPGSYSSQLVLW